MFRDLKEYQELQKLYESKVSKPEKLDEFTGLGVKQAVQMSKPKPKPVLTQKDQSDIKKEAGLQKVLNNKKNLQKIETKAAADKKEVEFRLKNTESSEQSAKAEARPKRRPVPSPSEAGMGPGAARARAMAKARIAAKKANPDQKQLSGKERAQAMAKARIAAKNQTSQVKPIAKPQVKTTQIKPLGKPQPKVKSPMDMRGESYDAYDMVLEYLLSTEQVATIEEANYVMVEMDAETIQDIVAEGIGQLKVLPTLVKGAAAVYGVKKGAEFLGRKKGESDIKPKKKFDPIGNARKKYQDKKATEYERKSGTTKEDGYFR